MKRCLIVVLLLLIGCAPWTGVGGLYKNTRDNYAVDLPAGWMSLNTNKYLFITRDGGLLQNIVIERIDIDAPFEHTKKKLSAGMLPIEVSEVVIDNISSDKAVLNLSVLENVPVTIDARDAFKVLFTYTNKDGLKFKSIYCGILADKWFYSIRYTAPDRHYFQKDVGVFEQVLNSFRLS